MTSRVCVCVDCGGGGGQDVVSDWLVAQGGQGGLTTAEPPGATPLNNQSELRDSERDNHVTSDRDE